MNFASRGATCAPTSNQSGLDPHTGRWFLSHSRVPGPIGPAFVVANRVRITAVGALVTLVVLVLNGFVICPVRGTGNGSCIVHVIRGPNTGPVDFYRSRWGRRGPFRL